MGLLVQTIIICIQVMLLQFQCRVLVHGERSTIGTRKFDTAEDSGVNDRSDHKRT